MNIILIITGLGVGGAECQVCDLADQYVGRGHRVLLISMTGETLVRPRSSDVEIATLNMQKSFVSFIRSFWLARRLINDFKPDVVHSHMVHANIFTRLLHISVPMSKLICTAHSIFEGGGYRTLAYRVTDSLCDFSTNVSQEAVEAFIAQGAVPEGRMVAMHNGIDTERFRFNPYARIRLRNSLGISNSVKVVLAVGRLTAAKDYQNLLCAFSQLEKKYNNTCLVIIGAGEELVKLTSIVDGIGISTKVHFLGMRRDVHDWMSAADLFVLSSAWEGFGLVVAEAMACERVVVATDCGGVKEVIGDVGILVPPKDSTALAKGLVQGLELRTEESCARGRLARQRVNECYSLSAQASRWLALYK